MPILATRSPILPQTAYLPILDESFQTLRSPTLFALPSPQGFSGTFPSDYATADFSLEPPAQQEFVLAREAVRTPRPSTRTLDPVALLVEPLTDPAKARTGLSVPQPSKTTFYFSNELQRRLIELPIADLRGPLPDDVCASLTVLPNGRVGQLFFNSPVNNPELTRLLRQLKFRPATASTHGQIEIRFVEEAPGAN